jgi:hypothetical protein
MENKSLHTYLQLISRIFPGFADTWGGNVNSFGLMLRLNFYAPVNQVDEARPFLRCPPYSRMLP